MRFERVIATAGPDGTVRFEIAGLPGRVYEVEAGVVEQPTAGSVCRTPEELGWPPGFFEAVIGSIDDDSFVRPPQPTIENRLSLDRP